MKPILDKIELGKIEPWNFTASDGTVITGKMCLPPNFDPNKKYPMIVYYYGGTSPTTRGISNPYCAQLFASRDYVVYVIQPSGTTGFGQEFSARHVNAWGNVQQMISSKVQSSSARSIRLWTIKKSVVSVLPMEAS